MERKLIRVTKTSVVSLLSVTALSQFVVVHADTTSTTDAASAPQESAVVVPSSSDPVVSENNTPAEMTTDSVVTTAVDAPATTYTLVPEETPAMSAPVVLAAETDPPVDEDIPNLEEEQQIKNVNDTLDMIVEFYNSGGVVDAQAVFEDSASDFAAINNIVDMVASKKALLQRIEDVRALIYGTTPTPVVTTRVEAIPMTTTYVADPNATAGVQTVTTAGKDGVKTYTTTNGVEDKGVITTPMTPKVVSVGTKSLVVTEAVVAPADIEQADATLEKGQRVLVSPAKDGSKTSTTTYSLDTSTGKVTANTPTVTTVAGQAAVYRVGTKDLVVTPVVTTRTEVIPMTITYVADPNATAGVQTVTTAGSDGEKLYTTTNGVEDAGVVTKVMVAQVISVGTKPLVVTEAVVAPADIEQADATLEKGQRVLVSPAKDGSKTSTTTYSLDTSTGKVTANTPTVTTVAGQAAVYRVGTKAVSEVFTEVVTKTIPFKTIEINSSNLEKGKTKILKQGLNGLGKITYRIVKVNGVEISREVISEELLQVPKDQLIEIGTKTATIPPSNTNKLNDNKENKKTVLSNSEFVVTKQKERQLPESGDSKSVVALISGMLITIVSTLMLKMSRRKE